MNSPSSPAPGSFGWQLVFVSFAIVLVLFEILRGWNRGLGRQLARLAALIAAYFAAFFGGTLVLPVVRPFLTLPDRVVSLVAGAALALIIYIVINGLGMFFFRRTRQYESVLARWLCGLGGAAVGLFFGWFLVWVIVAAVRSLGSIADAQVREQAENEQGLASSRTLHAVDVREHTEPVPEPPPLIASLARLKNSLELGSLGEIVKRTDVVPSQTYDTLGKISRVVSDPESAQRFLSFPGAEQLANHPRIIALRNDPEVAHLVEQGRFLELLQNQRVIDALNDPTLLEEIKHFDLQRALDFAIKVQ